MAEAIVGVVTVALLFGIVIYGYIKHKKEIKNDI